MPHSERSLKTGRVKGNSRSKRRKVARADQKTDIHAYVGYADLLNDQVVKGWVESKQPQDVPVKVGLVAGGTLIDSQVANLYRQDLAQRGSHAGFVGFSLKHGSGLTREELKVVVLGDDNSAIFSIPWYYSEAPVSSESSRTVPGNSLQHAANNSFSINGPTPRPVFVIAPQRSGTTMFQKTLSQDQNFDAFGEIFHDKQLDLPTNWFHFLSTRMDLWPLRNLPTIENTTSLFKEYLSYLQTQTNKPFFFVDIKQNSLHHLNLVWHHRFSEPFLLRLIKSGNYPIVRIIRKNVFLQVLSETYAANIGKFHFEPSEEPPTRKITIDVKDFEFRMAQFNDDNSFIDGHLSSYSNKIRFTYEELTRDGQLTPAIYEKLGEFLNTNIEMQSSYYRKSVGNPIAMIKNSKEVIDYFRNTKFNNEVVSALKKLR